MTKDQLKTEVKKLEQTFNTTVTQPRMKALWDVVGNYSYSQLQKGITHLINSSKFLPTNNEIIAAVRAAWEEDWEARKRKEDQEAKKFLQGAATSHGEYGQKAFRAMDSARVSSTITGKTFLNRLNSRKLINLNRRSWFFRQHIHAVIL